MISLLTNAGGVCSLPPSPTQPVHLQSLKHCRGSKCRARQADTKKKLAQNTYPPGAYIVYNLTTCYSNIVATSRIIADHR